MNNSPCAKLTTSMMPKMSVSPEAISARIMPVTMPFTVWMSSRSSGKLRKKSTTVIILHTQILVDDRVVRLERGGGRLVPDRALLHEIDALARREGERHVLLDQQDRDALPVQRVDDLSDLRHHARHQAFGRLVEQDDPRLEHHGAGDREHLLLAARQRAARLAAPLGEHREIGEDLGEQLLLARLGHATA